MGNAWSEKTAQPVQNPYSQKYALWVQIKRKKTVWLEQNEQAGGMGGDEDREIKSWGGLIAWSMESYWLFGLWFVLWVNLLQDLKVSYDLSKYRERERVEGRKKVLF